MTDTLTPPPLPDAEPTSPSSWTLSLPLSVGGENVHVVARMEPDTIGEARSRERLTGRPLIDILTPVSVSDWVAVAVAALIRDGFDGDAAVEAVDALAPSALIDAIVWG